MDEKWPREEEEYLMKVSAQCQYLSVQYNEIYNTYKVHETRFKLPVIVLGSAVGMLSFGASQFGPDNTDRITIGVGVSSIVISIISSIEAYLKIGETMTNSLVTATQLKKLKEKIDIELAVLPEHRASSSTVFLRQCHCEYMDIIEKAPPLQFKGILARMRNRFTRTPTIMGTGGATHHEVIQNKFRSIVDLVRQHKNNVSAMDSPGAKPESAKPESAPEATAPPLNPIRSKFQSMVGLATKKKPEETPPSPGIDYA
jgi:hypothetical protein